MLVLASLSPRRRELMKVIAPEFEAAESHADESVAPGTPPELAVQKLALRKASAVAELRAGDTVIGADTVVAVGGRILGKPGSEAHAAEILRALSGKEHFVYTGVAIVNNKLRDVFYEKTAVYFRELSDGEIAAYIATGEPMDKAGAYGIQGRGALFVRGICGDYYNVVGFPLCRLAQKLEAFLSKTE